MFFRALSSLMLVTVLLASALALAAGAQNSIPAFSEVSSGIYRGGRPDLAGMEMLASIGVRMDIDLQGGDMQNPGFGEIISWAEPGENPASIAMEASWASQLGIGFLNAPLNSLDEVTQNEAVLIDQTLSVMNSPQFQPVFIHCEHGVDRTGMLVALYRVKYQRWSALEAYQEWVAHGHGLLNIIVTHDLDRYFFSKVQRLGR